MYNHGKAVCSYQRNSQQRSAAHDKLHLFIRPSAGTVFVSFLDSTTDKMDLLQLHVDDYWRPNSSHNSDRNAGDER